MNRLLLTILVLAVMLASGAGMVAQNQAPTATGQQQQTPPPPGNAEEGRKLYVSYGCYQCHGYEGQGSSATGPRLGPRPAPYTYFSNYVRRPTNQMPPYTDKVVSDADLANIYAFLQSRPAPSSVDNIPLLK